MRPLVAAAELDRFRSQPTGFAIKQALGSRSVRYICVSAAVAWRTAPRDGVALRNWCVIARRRRFARRVARAGAQGDMKQRSSPRTARVLGLGALATCGLLACADGPETQVITGRISSSDATAVRAIDGDGVITAAAVARDGSFELALPASANYRLDVLTSSGVKRLYANGSAGLHELTFQICRAGKPWDVGAVKPSGGEETACTPDPMDPKCAPPTPSCSDPKDPKCAPPTPPCSDPKDPKCAPPPPCSDPKDPTCAPPSCPDPKNPTCASPTPPSCSDPKDPKCAPPVPSCKDPNDVACKDLCASDPLTCGCPSDEPACWSRMEPARCDASGTCTDDGALVSERPPAELGCQELP